MSEQTPVTRRSFISRASGAMGAGWVATQWPLLLAAATAACQRREADGGFVNLSEPLAATLEAMAEQIFPADESPGARKAGVVWFIDELLGAWAGMRPSLEAGAQDLDDRSGTGRRFADLDFEAQKAVLRGVEGSGFFSTVRFLTIAGMFAMPALGGNREKAGWRLIGFVDQHGWQPPFGNYDGATDEPAEEGRDS